MRRGVNGEETTRYWNNNTNSNNNNNALHTINAAASAIASAEARVSPPHNSQKKRWGSFLSIYWCFGSKKHSRRYSQAVLVPEPTETRNDASAASNNNSTRAPVVPFAAPPSSPASFLPSEPPSAAQSPVGVVSFTSMSNNIYSPGGPRNIFAIGPYAHETQLVSPPVFSTFTTEPSTAPFTPPPGSVQLTTPSSPEVPFAQLLDPRHRNGDVGQRFPLSHYEFPTYQIYPDSLVSPGSVMSNSGTSSPFPDRELYVGGLQYPDIRFGVPPKLMNLESPPPREWGSHQGSGALTPDGAWPRSGTQTPDGAWPMSGAQTPDAAWPRSGTRTPDAAWTKSGTRTLDAAWTKSGTLTPDATQQKSGSFTPNGMRFKSGDLVRQDSTVSHLSNLPKGHTNNEAVVDHRVSFELTAEDVIRCVEKEPTVLPKALQNTALDEDPDNMNTSGDATEKSTVEGEEGQRCQKQRSASLGSIKEFNFDNADGSYSHKPCIGPNWWSNEKVVGKEGEPCNKNWSFFPMMQQPGIS